MQLQTAAAAALLPVAPVLGPPSILHRQLLWQDLRQGRRVRVQMSRRPNVLAWELRHLRELQWPLRLLLPWLPLVSPVRGQCQLPLVSPVKSQCQLPLVSPVKSQCQLLRGQLLLVKQQRFQLPLQRLLLQVPIEAHPLLLALPRPLEHNPALSGTQDQWGAVPVLHSQRQGRHNHYKPWSVNSVRCYSRCNRQRLRRLHSWQIRLEQMLRGRLLLLRRLSIRPSEREQPSSQSLLQEALAMHVSLDASLACSFKALCARCHSQALAMHMSPSSPPACLARALAMHMLQSCQLCQILTLSIPVSHTCDIAWQSLACRSSAAGLCSCQSGSLAEARVMLRFISVQSTRDIQTVLTRLCFGLLSCPCCISATSRHLSLEALAKHMSQSVTPACLLQALCSRCPLKKLAMHVSQSPTLAWLSRELVMHMIQSLAFTTSQIRMSSPVLPPELGSVLCYVSRCLDSMTTGPFMHSLALLCRYQRVALFMAFRLYYNTSGPQHESPSLDCNHSQHRLVDIHTSRRWQHLHHIRWRFTPVACNAASWAFAPCLHTSCPCASFVVARQHQPVGQASDPLMHVAYHGSNLLIELRAEGQLLVTCLCSGPLTSVWHCVQTLSCSGCMVTRQSLYLKARAMHMSQSTTLACSSQALCFKCLLRELAMHVSQLPTPTSQIRMSSPVLPPALGSVLCSCTLALLCRYQRVALFMAFRLYHNTSGPQHESPSLDCNHSQQHLVDIHTSRRWSHLHHICWRFTPVACNAASWAFAPCLHTSCPCASCASFVVARQHQLVGQASDLLTHVDYHGSHLLIELRAKGHLLVTCLYSGLLTSVWHCVQTPSCSRCIVARKSLYLKARAMHMSQSTTLACSSQALCFKRPPHELAVHVSQFPTPACLSQALAMHMLQSLLLAASRIKRQRSSLPCYMSLCLDSMFNASFMHSLALLCRYQRLALSVAFRLYYYPWGSQQENLSLDCNHSQPFLVDIHIADMWRYPPHIRWRFTPVACNAALRASAPRLHTPCACASSLDAYRHQHTSQASGLVMHVVYHGATLTPEDQSGLHLRSICSFGAVSPRTFNAWPPQHVEAWPHQQVGQLRLLHRTYLASCQIAWDRQGHLHYLTRMVRLWSFWRLQLSDQHFEAWSHQQVGQPFGLLPSACSVSCLAVLHGPPKHQHDSHYGISLTCYPSRHDSYSEQCLVSMMQLMSHQCRHACLDLLVIAPGNAHTG